MGTDSRLTRGIRYETRPGRQLRLEPGNVVVKEQDDGLYLEDDGQTRDTVVLEADRVGEGQAPQGASEIDGVAYRAGMQYGGSRYKDGGSTLSMGRQACYFIDNLSRLQALLGWTGMRAVQRRSGSAPRALATATDWRIMSSTANGICWRIAAGE